GVTPSSPSIHSKYLHLLLGQEINHLFGFLAVPEVLTVSTSPQKYRTLLPLSFVNPFFHFSTSSFHSKKLHFGILPQAIYLLPWLLTDEDDMTTSSSPQKYKCLLLWLSMFLAMELPEVKILTWN
ncbi:hypothetical protein PIB30_093781, partial [Stylosanthes scabra]|nr:hypothetical protein [Stylosanthes scabra]